MITVALPDLSTDACRPEIPSNYFNKIRPEILKLSIPDKPTLSLSVTLNRVSEFRCNTSWFKPKIFCSRAWLCGSRISSHINTLSRSTQKSHFNKSNESNFDEKRSRDILDRGFDSVEVLQKNKISYEKGHCLECLLETVARSDDPPITISVVSDRAQNGPGRR